MTVRSLREQIIGVVASSGFGRQTLTPEQLEKIELKVALPQ